MGQKGIKAHLKKSPIKQALEKQKQKSVKDVSDCLVLSFRHFDPTQGATFDEWQSESILAAALNTLKGLCGSPLSQLIDKGVTVYGAFPPANKTEFKHPAHVPEDARWARVHVNGLQCIAGHVFQNTFFIVFFDTNHKFWISELKNT